jgi:hypothetical protein
LFLELSKGYYEVPNRPKSKVGFEVVTKETPVSNTGEGLLFMKVSVIDPKKMMANGWTTPKTKYHHDL